MTKRFLLIGIGLAAISVGAAIAQTSVDGLDLEAIDKRAHAGAADLSQFVAQVLHAQVKANAEQRTTVEGMVEAAASNLAAFKPITANPAAGGLDLDLLVSQAGQTMKPEDRSAPMFVAFASLSMPEDSLHHMIADVTKAGGMVVFRGFSSGGGRAFMDQLRKVVPPDVPAHISIDPRLFRAYRVEAVPTYVAASTSFALCSGTDCTNEPPAYDRLAGNVTTSFALETFAEGSGPGSPVARLALKNLRNGD